MKFPFLTTPLCTLFPPAGQGDADRFVQNLLVKSGLSALF